MRKKTPGNTHFGKREARLIAVELANELDRREAKKADRLLKMTMDCYRAQEPKIFAPQPEQSPPPSVSATDSGPVSAPDNTGESVSYCATPLYKAEQEERNQLAAAAMRSIDFSASIGASAASEQGQPKRAGVHQRWLENRAARDRRNLAAIVAAAAGLVAFSVWAIWC